MVPLSKISRCSLLLLCLCVPAYAAAKPKIEASTVVTGSIVVNADGSVRSYALDQPQKLSEAIVKVVAANVPAWTFKPYLVDGKPVAAKAAMSMRLVARRVAGSEYSVSVHGATFSAGSQDQWKGLKIERVAPKYPWRAVQDRVSGTVYLLAQVNRHGTTENVAAEQVDLRVLGSEPAMARWRNMLAEAAISAVRQWKFDATKLPFSPTDAYTTVRIPVSFFLRENGMPSLREAYGHWQSYVPGPVNIVPWLDQHQLASDTPDALPAGVIRPLDPNGLALRTQLDGS